jgi:O-antigen/teichoic acid export membrane protein
LRACGRIKLFAVQGIIGTVLTIGFNILFLIGFSMGVSGYVLSVVVADILVTVFLIFYAKLYNSFNIKRISLNLLKQMLKYSIPMIPTSIFWWVTNVSDRFLVDRICGENINGLYSAAYKIPTIITLICVVFIEAWQFSIMSDAEEKERSEFFGRVFDSFLSIAFFACSLLIVLSKVLSSMLFNESYYSAWQYIPILLLSTVFAGMVTFMGSVYVLRKKSIMSFITSAIGAFINISLNILLIPIWGAQGAAVATFASYFIVYMIRMIDTRRFIRFDTHNSKVLFNLIITTVQALIMVFEVKYWVLWELIIVLLITVVNAQAIIRGIKIALGIVIKKIKK